MVYDGFEHYFDELVGEYKYIENGVETRNMLPNINRKSFRHRQS
nr:DUF6705 family protein [Ichthyenterobacterium magnum]